MKKCLGVFLIIVEATALIGYPHSIVTAQASVAKGPYLGQTPPGKSPQIFASGFVSNRDIVGCTFSSDGQEFYFSQFISNSNRIMVTKHEESGWTDPEPFLLPVPDNSRLHGISMTLDGTIYTCYSNLIVRIVCKGQEFLEPEIVLKGYSGAYPAVAPDENFLVFTKQGNPRQLTVIFRNEDSSWAEPKNLGNKINQKGMNGYPYISYDGQYLFYTVNHRIYWISTEAIKDLRDGLFVP